jgi:hypothetical protein
MEEWKPIEEDPRYEISNKGNVCNKDGLYLKPYYRKGYLHVKIGTIKNRIERKVHRLVAIAFIDNPNNLPDVNHKDEIKDNNVYTNLEWCTKSYNNTYGSRIAKAKEALFVKVCKYSKDNVFIEEYKSIDEASKINNILACNITNTLKRKQKTAGGFIWKYK